MPAHPIHAVDQLSRSAHSHKTLVRFLVLACSGLVVFLFVFGPWASGGTPVWTRQVMGWVGLALLLTTGLILPIQHKRYPPRFWVFYSTLLILTVIGWVMSFNASQAYVFAHKPFFVEQQAELSFLPGAVDQHVGYEYMHALWPAIATAIVASIAAASRLWRTLLVVVMALVGISVAIAGLLQRVNLLVLAERLRNPDSPYAMFDFHGYAGSYLIVVTMLCIGLAFTPSPKQRFAKAWIGSWSIGALVAFSGLLLNVSEAAAVIGTLCVLILLAIRALRLGQDKKPELRTHAAKQATLRISLVTLASACIAGLVWVTGAGSLFVQWVTHGGMTGRGYMWQSAAGISGEAGILGYGPGSFKLVLPGSDHLVPTLYRSWIVTPYEPGTEISFWCHACNDTLQAVVEWGWLGASLWIALFAWALYRLLLKRYQSFDVSEPRAIADRYLRLGVGFALLGLLLHAQVDRPLQVASLQIYAGALLGLGWGWEIPNKRASINEAVVTSCVSS